MIRSSPIGPGSMDSVVPSANTLRQSWVRRLLLTRRGKAAAQANKKRTVRSGKGKRRFWDSYSAKTMRCSTARYDP
jgi:hypothetical protein